MKRIVRLTESDLTRLVRRIVNENTNMQAEVAIENCDENDDMAMERCVDNLFADMTEEDAENYIIELSKRKPKWLKKLVQWFRRTGRKIKREVRRTKRDFRSQKPKEKIFKVGVSLTFSTLATLFLKHFKETFFGDNSRMNESHIRRRFINEQGQGPIGGFGGPLTGTLVARNPDAEVRFGQDIEFTFRGIKNSGSAPITIKRILPMNSGMRIDKQVPFTVNPGETFELRAKQRLVRGGTSLEKVNEEGLVEFEGIIRVETDGKKQNYQLYCRQNLSFR